MADLALSSRLGDGSFPRLMTTFLLLSRRHPAPDAAGIGSNAGPAGEALLLAGNYFVARGAPAGLRTSDRAGRWAIIRGALPAIYIGPIRM